MSRLSPLLRSWHRQSRGRRESVIIVATMLILLLAAQNLVQAGSVGWRNGLLFSVASTVEGFLPGNVDVPVAIFAGIVTGWLILFAVDATKRIQTLVLFVVGLVVVVLLGQQDHVIGAVGNELPYFFGAAGITIALTILSTTLLTDRLQLGSGFVIRNTLQGLRLLHFPAASNSLFVTLILVIGVVTIQYPFMSRSSGDPAVPVVLLSGAVAIPSLALFINYESQTDVITFTPNSSSELDAFFFGGLFSVAQREYHGRAVDRQSQNTLLEAKRASGPNPQLNHSVRFKYLPKRLLRRIVQINSAVNYEISDVTDDDIEQLERRATSIPGILHQSARRILAFVYKVLPVSSGPPRGVVDSLETADVVLFVVEFPKPDEQTSTDAEQAAELLNSIKFGDRLDAKLVIAHANRAETDGETYNFNERGGCHDVLLDLIERAPDERTAERSSLSDLEMDHLESVYAVAGTPPFADARGFTRLLDEIDD